MIAVPLRVQQDLHVGQLEAQFHHVGFDDRDGRLVAAVDQEMTGAGRDQVGTDIAVADEIEISGDAKRLHGIHRALLRTGRRERAGGQGGGRGDTTDGHRPAMRRPMSIARNPASPQFMMNTLKPCFIRVSMSPSVAG
jgi:hypothetical protein